MGEREPVERQRMTSVRCAAEELAARVAIMGAGEHLGERTGDQSRAEEGFLVTLGTVASYVERLGAMREAVQRGARRDVRREIDRQTRRRR